MPPRHPALALSLPLRPRTGRFVGTVVGIVITLASITGIVFAQTGAGVPTATPDWCRNLPRLEYAKLKRIASPDPWFEVYEVRPRVFAIYEPHQAEEVISYLMLGERRALLFDTGLGIGNIQRVVVSLTKLPIVVVNSHTHNDHVGDNWRFEHVAAMNTGFTRQNAKGSRADAQAELDPGNLCGTLPAEFHASTYATKPWKIDRWIGDGARFDLGDRIVEVIATPGHTPDAVALLDRRNGLLFTGDSFYPGPIYLYRPETDLDSYDRSLAKLTALATHVEVLLPSHNVPISDPRVLANVLATFREVRQGRKSAVANGRNFLYEFEGFSFLMSKRF